MHLYEQFLTTAFPLDPVPRSEVEAQVYIIDTGFIVEGLLRSTYVGVGGKPFIVPLCETYHIRDGKAVHSNGYIDLSDLASFFSRAPGSRAARRCNWLPGSAPRPAPGQGFLIRPR